METNDFLRDKFNEIEILKGKLITYPKECSKDIITQIGMLCNEICGYIEKDQKDKKDKLKDKEHEEEKHKWEHKEDDKCKNKEKKKDREKDKDKGKSKQKGKCKEKDDDHKKDWNHDNESHKSDKKDKCNKKEHEVVDKVKKIYNGECKICKHKEKRINELVRMIEEELEDVDFTDQNELERLKNENRKISLSREYLKDLN